MEGHIVDRKNLVNVFMRRAVLLARVMEEDDIERILLRKKVAKQRFQCCGPFVRNLGIGSVYLLFNVVCCCLIACLFPYILCGVMIVTSIPFILLFALFALTVAEVNPQLMHEVLIFYSTRIPMLLRAIVIEVGPFMNPIVYSVWNATSVFI